jgi:chemotaxis signal transduction protein
MNDEVLVLEIDDHCYGLRVKHVREVIRAVALTPASNADDRLEGILNLRGQSVPVINVRRQFGFPDRDILPTDYLIVMQLDQRLTAIRVDRAVELRPIDTASIEAADSSLTSQRAVVGIVKFDERVVFLLDLESLLSESENRRLDLANVDHDSTESRS